MACGTKKDPGCAESGPRRQFHTVVYRTKPVAQDLKHLRPGTNPQSQMRSPLDQQPKFESLNSSVTFSYKDVGPKHLGPVGHGIQGCECPAMNQWRQPLWVLRFGVSFSLSLSLFVCLLVQSHSVIYLNRSLLRTQASTSACDNSSS